MGKKCGRTNGSSFNGSSFNGKGNGRRKSGIVSEERKLPKKIDFSNRHIVCSKILKPKTINQNNYVKSFDDYVITIGIGGAGTGKTMLATFYAIQQILNGSYKRLVITRPIVQAGEDLGFLPGELEEKVDPFMRPIIDAIRDIIGPKYKDWMDYHVEVAPLAYLRGRTLSDCVIIFDESQNAKKEQFKMFLTRIGENSKVIITADPTQIDLEPKSDSGIFEVMEYLKGKKGINFVYFENADIVRSEIVQTIVQAYSEGEENKTRRN